MCSAIFRQSKADVRRRKELLYVEPVQTGFPSDSDERYVYQEVSRVGRLHPEAISEGLFVSNHTLQVSPAVKSTIRTAGSVCDGQGPSSSVHGTGIVFLIDGLSLPCCRAYNCLFSHGFCRNARVLQLRVAATTGSPN